MSYSLPRDFKVRFDDLTVVARGMQRPECVLAFENGDLVASDARGGVSVVSASGNIGVVAARSQKIEQFVPNGVAVAPDGRVLFANLGAERGGIYALDADGQAQLLVSAIDGSPLPPSNYVMVDPNGVLWFTVSTRQRPRSLAWNHKVTDGFIGVLDAQGARIVADGLGYTNEIAFSADGRWVYVNETYAQRVSRFSLLPGPSLGPRETVVQLGGADLPDGIVLDEEGGLWLTCIASNRVLVVRPDGDVQVVLEDTDPEHAAQVEAGVLQADLQPAQMHTAGRSRLGNVSSLAFGGPDLKTAYLGCLLDENIRSFRVPVAGLKPAHWQRRAFARN
jgi:sugar lactone lactonase YvrE